MPKPRGPHKSWEERATEILAGRASVDAGSLIDLIHEVNPTGRGRRPDEEAARYAVKSRLQSLLVRRFAEEIEVLPEPDPAVASLRHRYHRHDACHAVIATLDDDARSWVQRELDVAGAPSSAPRGALPGLRAHRSSASAAASRDDADDDRSAEQLLRDGEEAQAAYDYDEAQRLFARAVEVSGGSPASALAFLALAVDALAADEAALAVEEALPAATLGHPGIALLLAIAAARAGDEERALGHLARVREARAAEPLMLLARRAIDEADPERAARRLREAEERDPAHPELRTLGEAVARLRAGERAPLETELAAHLAAGRDPEARALADAILARWPESEAARRASRQIEEGRRAAEARQQLATAEASATRGEHRVALEVLLRALAGPLPAAEREAALARVERLEALVREKDAHDQVARTAALLGAADPARGLGAYAELAEDLRAEIRARIASPALGFIDQILAARPGGRVKATVDAAVALERAAALADRDAEAAAASLAPHERALEGVPLARAIADRARASASAARRDRAVATLAEAERALRGGHADQARGAFDRLDARDLPDAERPRLAALRLGLDEAAERYRLARRFERLRGAGAFAAARAAAGELAARTEEPERGRWTAAGDALRAHVERTYAPQIAEVDGGPELQRHVELWRWGRPTSAMVADGGHALYLANAEAAWLFVRVLDLRTGRVVRVARFAIEQSMEEPVVLIQPGGLCVVAGGGLLELALPSLEVVRHFKRNGGRDDGEVFSSGYLPPGTTMLWGRYEDSDEGIPRTRVVDIEGEHADRSVPEADDIHGIPGLAEPRIACTRWIDAGHAISFHQPGGIAISRMEIKHDTQGLVAHPSGAGLAIAVHNSLYLGGAPLSQLHLVELSERHEVMSSRHIVGANVSVPPVPEIAVARDAGMVFLCFRNLDGATEVMGLRSAGRDGDRPRPLAEVYRVVVPDRTTLVHDTGSHRAFAMVDHGGGLAVAELGAEPPALGGREPIHVLHDPMDRFLWCAQPKGEFSRSVHQYVVLRRVPEAERGATLEALEAKCGDDRKELMMLFGGLATGSWDTLMTSFLARIEARFPDDPEGRVGRFTILAIQRAWPELLAALRETDPASFGPELQQHHHHLRSITAAVLGDLDEARSAHAAALATGGGCDLTTLGHVLSELEAPLTPEDLRHDTPTVRQHLAALRAADARLAAGDPAGAIDLLERPLVWHLSEAQSLARLVEAHLALPCATPADRFRRALALASFAEVSRDTRVSGRHEALVPGNMWPEDRLASLLERSHAWLEADQGVPRAPGWKR